MKGYKLLGTYILIAGILQAALYILIEDEFIEFNIFFSLGALSYFILRMRHILYGKWYRFSFSFLRDLEEIKRLAKIADSEELRQKCVETLHGLYIAAGYLLFTGLLGFVLTRLGNQK